MSKELLNFLLPVCSKGAVYNNSPTLLNVDKLAV